MTGLARELNLVDVTKRKSQFLFGPRGTGKSFLIRNTLKDKALVLSLLNSEVYRELIVNPENLRQMVADQGKSLVVIDEVQMIPQLLNEVHSLIEEKSMRFLLTGSSIRKLKAQNANMLGGRAGIVHLFPLTFSEIPKFDLNQYLRFGGLPAILTSEDPRADLSAYVSIYINEEIRLEANVRKIDFFHRFLESCAMSFAQTINYANVARDAGVSEPTVKSYYEILEDTLVGFQLFPWRKGKSRKSIAGAKFYFFDTGVVHTILRSPIELDRNSDMYGHTFEQFIAQELRAYKSYRKPESLLNFWRSLDKVEVDFVINGNIAIEVKSARKIKMEMLTGLKEIVKEGDFKARYLVTQDPIKKHIDGVECLPWADFLKKLWSGKIF